MCAGAPVLTSGTAYTPSTVTVPSASFATWSAGIAAVHVPSAASVASTGAVLVRPSVAVTDTPVASGCATPVTAMPASLPAVAVAMRLRP